MNTDTLSYPRLRQTWFGSCLEVLLPTQCLVCSRPIRGIKVCYRCRPTLPHLRCILQHRCHRCFEHRTTPAVECDTCRLFPVSADTIRFIWEYDGLARDFIRIMKYRPSPALLKLASHLLSNSIADLFPGDAWDAIVPIPQSTSNARKRLLHPCLELSRDIATIQRVRIANILAHNSTRSPQASRSHDERLRRLTKLFTVTKPSLILHKRVLVVEDVITTGATIAAAVHQLRKAGARRVDVLALARTRVWQRFRQRLNTIFAE